MPGPLPKDPALRVRQNRSSTRATLRSVPRRASIPGLPAAREWHPLTRDWWADVWRSPMAEQYLDADVHGLFILAQLVDAFWTAPTTALAAEIRQQRQGYGLTPIDRRRLEWEVRRAEDEPAKGAAGTSRRADPKAVLRALA